jgi:hypothetical protein
MAHPKAVKQTDCPTLASLVQRVITWLTLLGPLLIANPATGTVNASAAQGSSQGSSSGTSYNNTALTAANVVLHSAGNTTLQGAVVSGNTVTAVVGGNLLIQSPVNTSDHQETGSTSGFGVSLCIPPWCYGSSSGSVSAGASQLNGHFASVGPQQSGIHAGGTPGAAGAATAGTSGTGGFHVAVAGNTTLVGGVTDYIFSADYFVGNLMPGKILITALSSSLAKPDDDACMNI